MHPLILVGIGVAIVLIGVLVFRLHAFLALLLAAFTVALLTPFSQLQQATMPAARGTIENIAEDGKSFELAQTPEGQAWRIGSKGVLIRAVDTEGRLSRWLGFGSASSNVWRHAADVEVTSYEPAARFGLRIRGRSVIRVKPTDSVLTSAQWEAVEKASAQLAGERVARAFGDTCASIGILIALAAIIGRALLDSGAADRIVRGGLAVVGERGAPAAFVGSGFLLGIPVFFDTVFYLMIPLGKALARRTTRNYLLYVMTIVAGATMAHSLVPPTPGPLFVAEQLKVDLGKMVLAGCGVGIVTCSVGYLYAALINRRWRVPLRDSIAEGGNSAKAEEEVPLSELPPLWLAVLPILLPVVLIGGQTLLSPLAKSWSPTARFALETLGEKNTALGIAAAIALVMLVRKKGVSFKSLAPAISGALESGGVILLITAAGGAFGKSLQGTGITAIISEVSSNSHLLTITLAFFITTAVRTAQGSATVAMITAVGLLAGFVPQLGCDPVYLALAIGCGSKPLAWMNDSGFWVICKMSGMTEGEALRYITPLTLIMGLAGLGVTLFAAWLVPNF